MRKRTSRIYPDGITECNEVYAPFSDGWQYCDAIYKCDENGVMTCLWEKLAGKKLVSKPYVRVVAIRYIDGITYAMLFIYYGSAYTNGNYWVARYDSDNNRWIGIFMCNPPGLGLTSNGYVALVATKKGMMISTFVYNSNQGKFLFSSHKFAKIDKSDLDVLAFEKKTEGGFLEENEIVTICPYYKHSNTTDGDYFTPGKIDRYGTYDARQKEANKLPYYDYDGTLNKYVPARPYCRLMGKNFRFYYEKASIVDMGFYFKENEYDSENIIQIPKSFFNNEYIEYHAFREYRQYDKQIFPCFAYDSSERIVFPLITLQYTGHDFGTIHEEKTYTGEYLYLFMFTGTDVISICDPILLGNQNNGVLDADVVGVEKVDDIFVIYIEYEKVRYVYYGAMYNIQKANYTFNKNTNPGGAIMIDGELHILLSDKDSIYYNKLVKASSGAVVSIPTYIWQEE